MNRLFNDRISPRVQIFIPVLLFLFALSLRLVGLEKGLWYDEYASIRVATAPDFIERLQRYNTPPTYHAALRVWMQFYESENFLRLFSVIFGMLSLAALWKLVSKYGRLAGNLTLLVAATSLLLVRYSLEIRAYAMLMLATALTLFTADLVRRNSGRKYQLYLCLALCFAVAVHTVGVFLIPSVIAFLFCSSPSKRWRKWALWYAPPAILFGFLFLSLYAPHVGTSWWTPPLTWSHAKAIVSDSLGWIGMENIWFKRYVLCCAGIMTLWGYWKRSLPFAIAALVYLFGIILTSQFAINIFLPRTLVPLWTIGAVFVGVHVSDLPHRWLRRFVIVGLIAFSLFSSKLWVQFGDDLPSGRFRTAITELRNQWRDGDFLIVYPFYLKRQGIGSYYGHLEWKDIFIVPHEDVYTDPIQEHIETRVRHQRRRQGFANFYFLKWKPIERHSEKEFMTWLLNTYGPPQTLIEDSVSLYRFSDPASLSD